MRKLILIFIVGISIISFQNLKAQNEVDAALKYSLLYPNGTARYLGMGGAYGALGADFSTLSSNPAGIGLYKRSEFSFTPSFYIGSTKSDYLENTNTDNKYNFNFGNLGLIFTAKAKNSSDDTHGFKNFQFGFGINRTATFDNRFMIDGYNNKSSLMNDYINQAKGIAISDLHPFDTQMAYYTYLIDPIPPDSTTYSSALSMGKVEQIKSATISGSANEAVISTGANYDDKLYFGGSISIPYFNYSNRSNYSENDINHDNNSIRYFKITDKLDDKGVGFNIKLGMIYRITDWFRLGIAAHSPSFYKIDRTFKRNMHSELYNGYSYDTLAQSNFSYSLQTPAHFIGSAGFVIGKIGLIDVDYEYVDYSKMKLRNGSDEYDYAAENKIIQDIYRAQNNIRIGGEVKLNPIILRAGFNYSSSPYSNSNANERKSISLGLGFRDKNYYFDAGFMHTFYKKQYYLYDPAFVDPSNNTISNNTLSFTVGLKF